MTHTRHTNTTRYGTQQPIALLRQLFDYAGWYSRDKLTWREINNVQVLSTRECARSFVLETCVCVCIHIYIQICICMYVYTYMYIYIYIYNLECTLA
jgi:hypothetical protein